MTPGKDEEIKRCAEIEGNHQQQYGKAKIEADQHVDHDDWDWHDHHADR
ncbi:hypothetical protein ABIF64_002957 [Bradyrhizobium japonicum]